MTQKSAPPSFSEQLAACRRSAVHLEMRDSYYSNPRLEAWRGGERVNWEDRSSWWRPFHQRITDAVARGITVRRARIVSEPVTEYIRWEHYVTRANVESGEQVRWLPRRQASDLALPGNDFWLFDEQLVRWNHFTGDGGSAGPEVVESPAVAKLCGDAFEAVWERAIPHDEYTV